MGKNQPSQGRAPTGIIAHPSEDMDSWRGLSTIQLSRNACVNIEKVKGLLLRTFTDKLAPKFVFV